MTSQTNTDSNYVQSKSNSDVDSFGSEDIMISGDNQEIITPSPTRTSEIIENVQAINVIPLASGSYKNVKFSNPRKATRTFGERLTALKENKLLEYFVDIFFCSFIRLFFILESIFCIYYIINLTSNLLYLFVLVPLLGIIVDDIYVSVKRKGKDYFWGSISSFCYILIKLITIWSMVVYRHDVLDNKCELNGNTTSSDPLWRADLKNVCPFLEIFVSLLVLISIIGRWFYPVRRNISKEDISELLILFLNHGADIVDLFSYIDEEEIMEHYPTVLTIMVFFSLSVTQFSLVLFALRTKDVKRTGFQAVLDIVFGTAVWRLVYILVVQEIPFFIIRVVILSKFEKTTKNYTLYFMGLKNITRILIASHQIWTQTRDDLAARRQCQKSLASSELYKTN